MVRIAITENEVYPEYHVAPVDPEILAEHPDAGYEADQALIDEYGRASEAWAAVQAKLGELLRERAAGEPHA
jgi:hypothetical protein